MSGKFFDVVVIGAGHAGIEAACSAYRMGSKVALITITKSNIGEMSCNPSIGGIGKGTIVREIDALGGVMGLAADNAAINYKILNKSRGPAVWGWRSQIDRKLYKKALNQILQDKYCDLTIIEDLVDGIIFDNNVISGVKLKNNESVFCKSIVICSGTFLKSFMYRGDTVTEGGRVNEISSVSLSDFLSKELNFELIRFKTGTPPRLVKDTIDFSCLEEQKPDEEPIRFSSAVTSDILPQLSCYITYTNKDTHDVVLNNKEKSPVFMNKLASKGPRYCVSIEDKMNRFPDKVRHQIFLEPEGLDSDLFYPNGITTSMPESVQLDFLRTMKGLENVEIFRPGYAVEYDAINPVNLYPTLESKKIPNLFFAGQVNGTTGYEEAAGQGLIAGINASLKSKNSSKEFVLNRTNSYIGVMIDDLTTFGIGGEPYRVFTSRSEYRLTIRGDNSYTRLTQLGIDIGCVSGDIEELYYKRKDQIYSLKKLLNSFDCSPNFLKEKGFNVSLNGVRKTMYELLKSNFTLESLCSVWDFLPEKLKEYEKDVVFEVVNDANYDLYIERNKLEILKVTSSFNVKLDVDFDYSQLKILSKEEVEKLNFHKPTNIGAASRIPGVTPVAITGIMHYLSNKK